jgi:hypothetical protein
MSPRLDFASRTLRKPKRGYCGGFFFLKAKYKPTAANAKLRNNFCNLFRQLLGACRIVHDG